MTYVHSFDDILPSARFDGLPWTIVRTEQSADGATGWDEINSQSIAPDATPATPNPVDVTVPTATLAAGWFRFRFEDAAGRLSPYTAGVLSPSDAGSRPTLAAMCDQDGDPALTDDELDAILFDYRRPDSDGNAVTDAAWTLTYDLHLAAAEAWRRKAGKVASEFDFTTDANSFRRSQKIEQLLRMAALYAQKGGMQSVRMIHATVIGSTIWDEDDC